ncbi:hypothetical protein [Paraburkholderia antibiotica]|uniref:Uncharacterized protein n=1 Tax=Paraburkholderia antibiotica TaxID=2728839 RepID=A0A7X9X599_9BURK|nr:hypothetical protein [Paraburkholderia antibiotica]NML31680.1 hypothetical protein [Paraburkholderia antibiotica]
MHAYAFAAVFVAGVALRHDELRSIGDRNPLEVPEDVSPGERSEVVRDPHKAHAVLAESMRGFTLEPG